MPFKQGGGATRPPTLTVNTTEVVDDGNKLVRAKWNFIYLWCLEIMSLSIQLDSIIHQVFKKLHFHLLFSSVCYCLHLQSSASLLENWAGKFKKSGKNLKVASKEWHITQWVFNLETWNLIHISKTCVSEMSRSFKLIRHQTWELQAKQGAGDVSEPPCT